MGDATPTRFIYVPVIKCEVDIEETAFFTTADNSQDEKNALYIVTDVDDSLSEVSPKRLKKYECDECGKAFATIYNLKNHKVLHTGDLRFSCEQCGQKFSNYMHLRKHRSNHRKDITPLCPVCGKLFTQPKTLNVHMRIHNGQQFVCKECNAGFPSRHGLKVHTLIHTGEKNHSCEVCGKLFRHLSALNVHKRRHTGEKPYQCKTCGMRFSDNSCYLRHSNVHNKDKDFTCTMCGKSYLYSASLQRHVKNRHHLKDDVDLPLPDKTPAEKRKRGGKKTVNKVLGEPLKEEEPASDQFTCDECGECFLDFSQISKHMLTHAIIKKEDSEEDSPEEIFP